MPEDVQPRLVERNTVDATTHSALYGCSIAIHAPDDDGRMWTCTNPRCPVGPVGWITESRNAR